MAAWGQAVCMWLCLLQSDSILRGTIELNIVKAKISLGAGAHAKDRDV